MAAIGGGGVVFFAALTNGRASVAERLRGEIPPCFEIGAPFHHRYRSDCAGTMNTPNGKVAISTNESGLRDRPLPEILSHERRILVMGDSFVEGWWMAGEQSIAASLGQRIPGYYFVNGGLRSTGPLLQAETLVALVEKIRPSAIVWFLNDTDPADDRLACALLKDQAAAPGKRFFDTADFTLKRWQEIMVRSFAGTSVGAALRLAFYRNSWMELVRGKEGRRCGPCFGIQSFMGIANGKKIPVFPIFLELPGDDMMGKYEGNAGGKEEMLQCLIRSGGAAPVRANFDKISPEERGQLFWPGDFHLNPLGIQRLTDTVAGSLKKWLSIVKRR